MGDDMNEKSTWNSGSLYDPNTRNDRALSDEDRAKGQLRKGAVDRMRLQRSAHEDRRLAKGPQEVWEE
ncbi:hypothetical protein JHS3_09500 [Jeongeupia sp. HS-3]|nr:hypothetical protein JHS3_09500 [Jeongeupia sp. HS-3]